MVKVLLVDDNPREHRVLGATLPDPWVLLSAYTAREGIDAAARDAPDVILLDVGLPDMDGVAVLRALLARPCPPPVVMLTAMGDPRVVKEAVLAGACDYLVKPHDLGELLGILARAVAGADGRRDAAAAADDTLFGALIGDSPAMREVRATVLRYARSESPVLVLGESGTGKELVARALHDASRRRGQCFTAMNCGAIPPTLLESELFGAERGAFTDAVARRGCFERASGGTLFLDEVGELPAAAQAALLRAVEQREVLRVGGQVSVAVDVRIVSATHRDLKPGSGEGNFRADLWYRLGVLPLRVPPLRERAEDVPALAAHFLRAAGRPGAAVTPHARERLCRHPWPGNVRELRNVMERAALSAGDGPIRPRDLLFD